MADLYSRIEVAKGKMNSLQEQIGFAQKSKKGKSIGQIVQANGFQPATVRGPPSTRIRRTLKGHFGKVTALHWGGDSRTIVSAGQDGNLLIWNAVTSNKIEAIPLKSSYVMAVGMEQSSMNLVACGGLDNLCTVYNRSNPSKAVEMASHDGFLSCCRFLSEQQLLSSSGDSTCIHWDITKALPINRFAEHTADAMFLSLKPNDSHVFVSCSVDKTVKVWDTRTPGPSVQSFGGHHLGDINGVEFLSDGQAFATCSQDETVRVFDLRAYNELNCFGTPVAVNAEIAENEGFTSLAVSRSGRLIFCGHSDGNVYAYDVLSDKGTPLFTLTGAHDRQVSCVGVSPQGNALCTGSWDSLLKIWA